MLKWWRVTRDQLLESHHVKNPRHWTSSEAGSQPSNKGQVDWLAGTVRIEPLFRGV